MVQFRYLAAAMALAVPSIAHADVAYTQVNPNAYGISWTNTGSAASFADIATPGYSDLLVNLTLHTGSVVQALFNISGSTSTAAVAIGSAVYEQVGIGGSFSFTDSTSGQNYLSGSFGGATLTGSGSSGSLFNPAGGMVNYTGGSEATSSMGGFSIALNNTNHPIGAAPGKPLGSFSAHTSGTFSAQAVPEMSVWAMLIIGFVGLGVVARDRGFKLPGRMPSASAA